MPPSAADTLPRLDIATAISNLGGDRELYAQVTQIFLDDVIVQLASLDAALAAGDFVTARRDAHTVKGTAASLGCERLRHYALIMEKACEAADPAAIATAAPAFRAEIDASTAALREYLADA